MKVYVVSHGFDYEGSIIVGVYSKRKDAINYILNHPAEVEEKDDGMEIEHKMEEKSRSSDDIYFSNNYGEYFIIK